MNLNDLKAMVADDIIMDDTELDIESLKTPQLHNKYLNFFHDEKLIYVKQEEEYKKLYRLKWEYYTGKMDQDSLDKLEWEPFQLNILKVDIEKYLSSDDDLSLIRLRLSYTKEKVDYLESVIKIISNRQWNIRSAIDWRKFLNGV
jgi:hypothetical protein|tara:strand:- start:2324 stop:2758 length:435 start_codon:yes stop_codon:yes gene_type:complete